MALVKRYQHWVIRLLSRWYRSPARDKLNSWRYKSLSKYPQKPIPVTVYLALNDPYSYLLVQVLPQWLKNHPVKLSIKLISEALVPDKHFSKQWHQWALHDAQLLAQEIQLKTFTQLPSIQAIISGQQLWQLQPKTLDNIVDIFHQVWQPTIKEYFPISTPVINHLLHNQQQLLRQGFYLPASINCLGRWYWGIDRLPLLVKQLDGLCQKPCDNSIDQFACINHNFYAKRIATMSTIVAGCEIESLVSLSHSSTDDPNQLVLYLSLRSPYSYLAWQKIKQLIKQYHVPLSVRFVLPLKMRGVQVSRAKMSYIYLDAARQCELLNIPFKQFSDPLGGGVENASQLLNYMEDKGKLAQYIDAIYDAVYNNGQNLAATKSLVRICQLLNVDYQAAKIYDKHAPWQVEIQQNQQALNRLNFWGVPCLCYQTVRVWGQDRFYRIEQQLIKAQAAHKHNFLPTN
jgi:2-hydroxychromene-2-carboxylate isomerase